MKFLIFLAFLISLSAAWEITDDLTLQIKDGKILGRYLTSETGKPVKAFMSIPYAEPPVGDLRFKAPQKAKAWDGIKNTQFDVPKCVQVASAFAPGVAPFGSEDCLHLNVYTPAESDKRLPVVVWFHGGAFSLGDSSRDLYGPDYIVDHDVILVSGNYRLGVFGFLSTEDGNAQGNQGLKDQNLVLQWVQNNIEYFGGNKSDVTIWGESAGSVAVNYLMLSPMAKGLFHKAISNSGTIYNAWADPWRTGEAFENTKRLATAVNCPTTNSTALITCLRSKTASELASAGDKDSTNWENRMVIEDFNEKSETAFLPTRKLSDESVNIPWMLGINSEEGLLLSSPYIQNETLRNLLIFGWSSALASGADFSHLDANTKDSITRQISRFYFGSESLTAGFDMKKLTDFFTDISFLGIVEALKHRFAYDNAADTFVYLFTHKGSASMSLTNNYEGTSHADDLIYLFPFHKTRFMSSMPTADDEIMMRMMPELWTNFVKYGNPTPSSQSIEVPQWPVATSIPFKFMIFGNQNGRYENLSWFNYDEGLYTDRANFWMSLREDYKLSRWSSAEKVKVSLVIMMMALLNIFLK